MHRFSEANEHGLHAQVESLKSLSEGKPKYACGLTDGSDSISAILATQVRPAFLTQFAVRLNQSEQ